MSGRNADGVVTGPPAPFPPAGARIGMLDAARSLLSAGGPAETGDRHRGPGDGERGACQNISHKTPPGPSDPDEVVGTGALLAGALRGRRILVTRAREQASVLSTLIRDEGGEPVELPTIRIRPPDDWTAVDAAMDGWGRFDWVAFTSVNGVEIWMRRAAERELEARSFGAARIAAIGPATARALRAHGLRANLVPPRYVAESLLDELLRAGVRGKRVLLPRAAEARKLLAEGLRGAGAEVVEVALYDTLPDTGTGCSVLAELEAGAIDAATFTSSSTVRNFAALAGEGRAAQVLTRTRVVCIGPVTAATARDLGIRVDGEAEEHTIPGLVEELKRRLAQDAPPPTDVEEE